MNKLFILEWNNLGIFFFITQRLSVQKSLSPFITKQLIFFLTLNKQLKKLDKKKKIDSH